VLALSEWELDGTAADLGKTLQRYVDSDDVCTYDFTDILVVKPSETRRNNSILAVRNNFSSVYYLQPSFDATGHSSELPSGPYFLRGPNLHQAWRLYPDELNAFTVGMVPEDLDQPTR
jgi:hypothetical protein